LLHEASTVSGSQLAAQSLRVDAALTPPPTHVTASITPAGRAAAGVQAARVSLASGGTATRFVAPATAPRDSVFESLTLQRVVASDDDHLRAISAGKLLDESYADSVDELFTSLGRLVDETAVGGRS
jgi:hypothetical protein